MSAPVIRNEIAIEAPEPVLTSVQPDTSDLIGIARRGWFLILGGIAIGIVGALIRLSLMLGTGALRRSELG